MMPKTKPSKDVLKFVSESQKLSGFSGHISEATAAHEPDMNKITEAAKKFGAQMPVCGYSLKDLARVIGAEVEDTTHLYTHQVLDLLGINIEQLHQLVDEKRVIRQEWGGDETLYPIEQFLKDTAKIPKAATTAKRLIEKNTELFHRLS